MDASLPITKGRFSALAMNMQGDYHNSAVSLVALNQYTGQLKIYSWTTKVTMTMVRFGRYDFSTISTTLKHRLLVQLVLRLILLQNHLDWNDSLLVQTGRHWVLHRMLLSQLASTLALTLLESSAAQFIIYLQNFRHFGGISWTSSTGILAELKLVPRRVTRLLILGGLLKVLYMSKSLLLATQFGKSAKTA